MDIVIHKSLIEPLTFPWACIRPYDNTALPKHIRQAISDYFNGLEDSDQVPTDYFDAWGVSQFSVAELLDTLKLIALEEGAKTARVTNGSIRARTNPKTSWKLIGFNWMLEFTVPNDSRTHAMTWKSWFRK